MARKHIKKIDPATSAYLQGLKLLEANPMFGPMLEYAHIIRDENAPYPRTGWASVTINGSVYVHPKRRALPEEWFYVLSHCLLHLGFGHFQEYEHFNLWNAACDCLTARFMHSLKIGRAPEDMGRFFEFPASSEQALYRDFCAKGIPPELQYFSTAGPGASDMIMKPADRYFYWKPPDWQKLFGRGLAIAVSDVVNKAANVHIDKNNIEKQMTTAQRALRWFVSSYPLLGALAANFRLIEDRVLCSNMDVRIAAVNPELKEIYLNPVAGLDEQQCRFVLAHEMLHVGLSHDSRCQGRDAYLWNIACDYVINGWLVEMGIGDMPQMGILYDPELKGLSSEAVYDRIVTDMRRCRKLATLRGAGLGDILNGTKPEWWAAGRGIELDEFYRGCLEQGLEYHESQGRGHLPAGLIEEIRALNQPPIPWDVELARWFDDHFLPIEKRRTYARPSRRQSSTPDIPRPCWTQEHGALDGRTFGVVLDTSGSMDRNLLAKALGTIASYSIARDVPLVRVVFCDAVYYDQGYMSPEVIAETVKVKGRGGTVIQPAIDMLEKTEDFPKDGPILVITDGYCDRLRIHRDHGFVIPKGRYLPFAPRGKVFYIH
ncbi:MAG: peptidase [Desulfobacteraceae bacterium]|nr:peptidase [Desulfobacteraceae bacterium]